MIVFLVFPSPGLGWSSFTLCNLCVFFFHEADSLGADLALGPPLDIACSILPGPVQWRMDAAYFLQSGPFHRWRKTNIPPAEKQPWGELRRKTDGHILSRKEKGCLKKENKGVNSLCNPNMNQESCGHTQGPHLPVTSHYLSLTLHWLLHNELSHYIHGRVRFAQESSIQRVFLCHAAIDTLWGYFWDWFWMQILGKNTEMPSAHSLKHWPWRILFQHILKERKTTFRRTWLNILFNVIWIKKKKKKILPRSYFIYLCYYSLYSMGISSL